MRARRPLRLTTLVAAAAVVGLASPALAAPGGGEDPPPEEEDLQAPRIVVTADRPSPWQGWYAGDVTLHVRAFDDQGPYNEGLDFVEYRLDGATSGVGRVDNAGGGPITVTNAGVTHLSIAAFDNAGNIGRLEYSVGIDRTRPSVAFVGRLAGDRIFYQGEKVPADYTCSDVGTEVASCAGPVGAGADLDTSTIGSHVIDVEATDRVGNSNRVPLDYQVFARSFAAETRPVVAGSPVVGETLFANPATFSPPPTSSGVRWYRDGQLVASDEPYSVTAADVGTQITAVSYANRAGWPEGTSTSDPVTVRAAQIQVAEEPTLQGEAQVGRGLFVPTPSVTPSSATVAYEWFRDGTRIDWTHQFYGLGAADRGHRYRVRVTISAPGHTTRTWDLGPSAVVVGRQLEVVGRPTVTGTRRVGSVLTAEPPLIRELPESRAAGDPAHLAYQWFRDGRAIPRATARTYRLGAADGGRRLTVRVTGTAPGHEPAAVTSAATLRIARATPVVRAAVRPLGGGRARITVRATAPRTPVTGVVTVRRGGAVVLRRSLTAGSLTAVLTRQPRGRVTYTVAYGGSGGVAARTVRVTARLR